MRRGRCTLAKREATRAGKAYEKKGKSGTIRAAGRKMISARGKDAEKKEASVYLRESALEDREALAKREEEMSHQ